jgi:uncharacterized repeat protein (TIGR03803 family)
MSTKLSLSSFNLSLPVIAVTLILITSASAGTEQVLFRSTNIPGTLIFDSAGNLYGMTYYGGRYNGGTVFKLSPSSGGAWTETVLHSFDPVNHKDGGYPYPVASLLFDSAGNLYGTTTSGGEFEEGTVFELTPGSNGSWTETTLHSFAGLSDGDDGAQPLSNLVFDASGNLYGTTTTGGSGNAGTVFELSPGKGGWTEKVLYSFSPSNGDAMRPIGGVVFDGAGNLYGTGSSGGRGLGAVFELSPGSNGTWTETVLHKFKGGADGGSPFAGLVIDTVGNLYGTTQGGGARGKGVVFALTPASGGGWITQVIYSFMGAPGDGGVPLGALILDAASNLYGTTLFGGTNKLGTVFKLVPASGGGWTESVLYSFTGSSNGRNPSVGVILDPRGNLYGAAAVPRRRHGIVFEITP